MSKMKYGTFRFQGFRARQELIRAAAAADRAWMRKGWGPTSGDRAFPWVASSANGLPVKVVLEVRRVRWGPPLVLRGRLCSDAFLAYQRVDVAASAKSNTDFAKQLYFMMVRLLLGMRYPPNLIFFRRFLTDEAFRLRVIKGVTDRDVASSFRSSPRRSPVNAAPGAGKTTFLLALERRRLWAEQRGQTRDAVAFASLQGPSVPVARRRNDEDDGEF